MYLHFSFAFLWTDASKISTTLENWMEETTKLSRCARQEDLYLIEQNPEGVFHDLLPSRSLATSSSRSSHCATEFSWNAVGGLEVTIHKNPPLPGNNAFRCGTITSAPLFKNSQHVESITHTHMNVIHPNSTYKEKSQNTSGIHKHFSVGDP